MPVFRYFPRTLLTVCALAALTFGASAQSQPSPDAVNTARQILVLKGGDTMFNALIPGVIEQAKSMFEVQNPMLNKDLRETANKMRADMAPRSAELVTEVAKIYASKFSEQELKDILAFYQSPLGRKVVAEEPRSIDESMNMAQTWSQGLSDEVLTKMRAEMKKRGHDL
jgi:hypothetical protein